MDLRRFSRIVVPDVLRMLRYGARAPRMAEQIWVRPADCVNAVTSLGREMTGRVVDGDWDLKTQPVADLPKVRIAELHWQDGLSWRDAGAYDYMMQRIRKTGELDRCRTLADVIARYDHLDRVFEQVRRDGRLRTQSELRANNLRERGGVYVHVGRGNVPLFGMGGCHRLAMAKILKLDVIPAQLGVVHPAALARWRSFRSTAGERKPALQRNPSTSQT